MAARHCNGSVRELIGRDGSHYCSCGAQFDDGERSLIWPHGQIRPLSPLAEITGIVGELRALDGRRVDDATPVDNRL